MTDITYRPYQERDATDVKSMINEAFHIHRYMRTNRPLDSALEFYLRDRLLASTYARVALMDGRVVGVVMGRVPGTPRLPHVTRNRLLTWFHLARIVVTGFFDLRSLAQFFTFDAIYRRLRRATSAPLTDELTLFAVDASTRGSGVGTTLYQDYMRHLRHHDRTDFYLYTDSLCSYGFYEKRGMTRTASEDMRLRLDGDVEDLGVFLYAGRVPEASG
ncbi:GNAT family N-acetyltransferase [Spiractinospora alimapuensis]|uniref:GNAT family N-acetyltransferase n=1 Tax=Spiractinospora alimapuensis TaxID=2820884 RepID=UPI001F3C7FC7|nr:GNAT family N-acetyltransferase [Spiractinospora alimapuensis]QVQ52790.1 GNAT family N-acetyltransferase [Spiractinospora alimapuensis]